MTDPGALLDAFARDGWDCDPFERMLELVSADSANAAHLLSLAMQGSVKHATFLDAAISFVPEAALPDLAREAVEALVADRENEVAERAISYLSLQAVGTLQPFVLQFFFDLRPNAPSHYADWPWRGATVEDVRELLDFIEVAESPDERLRAFRCVLESRRVEGITAVLERLRPGDLRYPVEDYLQEVGLERSGRPLYADGGFHLCFPMSYLEEVSRPPWSRPSHHPSWTLEPGTAEHRFGGFAEGDCGVCGKALHNLLSLRTVPPGIGVSSREALDVVTCLSCLGWSEEPLFFRHDASGRARPPRSKRVDPEFPAKPMKQTTVRLAPTPRRWQWQDWALSNNRENLHRVGGHPTWVQSARYPSCPDCGRTMPLLLQLDSDLPGADGEGWLWGSGGICFVFWCDECSASASFWQCT